MSRKEHGSMQLMYFLRKVKSEEKRKAAGVLASVPLEFCDQHATITTHSAAQGAAAFVQDPRTSMFLVKTLDVFGIAGSTGDPCGRL